MSGRFRSGFVSFLGRPNAGKSTLLNRIVGHKLAIVSDKPQTTRTRIVGVKNYGEGQIVFVDTPGVHKPTHRMNVRMVDIALESMREVELLAQISDSLRLPARVALRINPDFELKTSGMKMGGGPKQFVSKRGRSR